MLSLQGQGEHSTQHVASGRKLMTQRTLSRGSTHAACTPIQLRLFTLISPPHTHQLTYLFPHFSQFPNKFTFATPNCVSLRSASALYPHPYPGWGLPQHPNALSSHPSPPTCISLSSASARRTRARSLATGRLMTGSRSLGQAPATKRAAISSAWTSTCMHPCTLNLVGPMHPCVHARPHAMTLCLVEDAMPCSFSIEEII